MNSLSCAELRDLAAELALDALDGDQRSAALAHLDTCASCREAVDDLARTADTLLAALPAHDVPAELSARLHASVPRRLESASTERTHRRASPGASPWRHAWVAAAAALLVVVAGVVLTVRSADTPHGGRGDFDLVAAGGETIGSVSIDDDKSPWISMTVERGQGSGTLTCVVVLDDASTVTVGVLSIADGKGSWGGPLGPEPDRLESAKLLDSSGAVVATAAID